MCENSYCVWQKKSDNMFDYAVFFTSHIHRLLSKKKKKNKRESEKKSPRPTTGQPILVFNASLN